MCTGNRGASASGSTAAQRQSPYEPPCPSWHCSTSSKLHLLDCFILKISPGKPSSFIKICLGFLPSVSIYKEERSPKKDKRKAEKSMSPKAFIGEKIKVLGTRFHSTEHCSASCLTHLFTCRHQSRWQGTKGHMSWKELKTFVLLMAAKNALSSLMLR